jgi:hypothetical protein
MTPITEPCRFAACSKLQVLLLLLEALLDGDSQIGARPQDCDLQL